MFIIDGDLRFVICHFNATARNAITLNDKSKYQISKSNDQIHLWLAHLVPLTVGLR